MRSVSVRRTFALCAALLSLGLLPATAAATSSEAEIDTAIEQAVEYVRTQQEAATGGFPQTFGANPMTTSLAAAGVGAAELRVGAGDPSLQDYLLGEYGSADWGDDPPQGLATDYEQATLISYAAGLDPARLSAVSNQPAQVAAFWNPATGSFDIPSANAAAFGILALRTTPLPRWALAPVVSFLRRNQHDDGGWTYAAALTPAAKANPSEDGHDRGGDRGPVRSGGPGLRPRGRLRPRLPAQPADRRQRGHRVPLRIPPRLAQRRHQRLGRQRAQRLRHRSAVTGLDHLGRQDPGRLPALAPGPGWPGGRRLRPRRRQRRQLLRDPGRAAGDRRRTRTRLGCYGSTAAPRRSPASGPSASAMWSRCGSARVRATARARRGAGVNRSSRLRRTGRKTRRQRPARRARPEGPGPVATPRSPAKSASARPASRGSAAPSNTPGANQRLPLLAPAGSGSASRQRPGGTPCRVPPGLLPCFAATMSRRGIPGFQEWNTCTGGYAVVADPFRSP